MAIFKGVPWPLTLRYVNENSEMNRVKTVLIKTDVDKLHNLQLKKGNKSQYIVLQYSASQNV